MSSSSFRAHDWEKAPAAVAIAITAVGAALAAFWFLIAGLWTFSTGEYGAFIGITAIAAFLIGSPIAGFMLASKRGSLPSLAATTPALLLYCFTLFVALST